MSPSIIVTISLFTLFFKYSRPFNLVVNPVVSEIKSPNSLVLNPTDEGKIVRLFVCAVVPFNDVPFSNLNYTAYFNKTIHDIENNTSSGRKVKVETHFFYKNYIMLCEKVYDEFVKCFDEMGSTSIEFNSFLIFGPWCAMEKYERSVKAMRHKFLNISNASDVAILTTSQNMMPLYGEGHLLTLNENHEFNDKAYQPTLMLLTGELPRVSMLIWHMLSKHFGYEHIALVALGKPYSWMVVYCQQLFEMFQVIALSGKPRLYNTIYTWYFPNEVHPDRDYEEVWLTLKHTVKIILLCAEDKFTVRLIQTIQIDNEHFQNKHGVFVITRNNDTLQSFLERLSSMKAIEALEFVKILVFEFTPCAEFEGRIGKIARNRSMKMSLEERDRNATLDNFMGEMYCALLHYYRKIDEKGQRLASVFAETYDIEQPRMRSRKGRAVQWLPIMNLYSANEDEKSLNIVLSITWHTNATSVEPYVHVTGKILWYHKDETLFDAFYICDNISTFYPCQQAISAITSSQVIVIVFSVLFGISICAIVFYLPVRYYIRNNRKYLLNRLSISTKHICLAKEMRYNHLVVGMYGERRALLFPLKTQLERNELESAEVLRELDRIARLSKSNKNKMIPILGFICAGNGDFKIVFALDAGRCLSRILKMYKLSSDLRLSLIRDLAMSMYSIHESYIKVHGDLKIDRCVVDDRFILRVMLTHLMSIKVIEMQRKLPSKTVDPYNLLWTAPELIRKTVLQPTQASDVYSFGIIMHDISFQHDPFYLQEFQGKKHGIEKSSAIRTSLGSSSTRNEEKSDNVSVGECCAELIRSKIKKGSLIPSMPFVHQKAKYHSLDSMIVSCWCEQPEKRPTFSSILSSLNKFMKENHIDVAVKTAKRLVSVSRQMVTELNNKKAEVIRERDQCMKYLTHLMPPSVSYEFMKEDTVIVPELCENVTIYFNDLVEFNLVQQEPQVMIATLDELFQAYDKIVTLYNVMPLHRVGSSLLLASGVVEKTALHASEVAQAALQIRHFAKSVQLDNLRAGIHSGSAMCGVVGKNIYQFGLFGDTVNTASRMASTGKFGEIQISEPTHKLLAVSNDFEFSGGQLKVIKGKGNMKTYWLQNYRGYTTTMPIHTQRKEN